jgi:hypothetical protein
LSSLKDELRDSRGSGMGDFPESPPLIVVDSPAHLTLVHCERSLHTSLTLKAPDLWGVSQALHKNFSRYLIHVWNLRLTYHMGELGSLWVPCLEMPSYLDTSQEMDQGYVAG